MERVLEPELMEDEAGALAYAQSDFSEPHNEYVAHFKRLFPNFRGRLIADLGCGTADPTIRFARAHREVVIIGMDGSDAMLRLGRKAVLEAGLMPQIVLEKRFLPDHGQPYNWFDAVISNSLLHHLPDPNVLWESAVYIARPGAPIFVMDLTRPDNESDAERLVELHAKGAPELMARDFYNSLLAAFTPEEVRTQLNQLGLTHFQIETPSNRHMLIYGRA